GPGRPRVAAIGLQEDARPGQLTRRRLPLDDEGLQLVTFVTREAHDKSLVHDRTPSQHLGRICQDWKAVMATYQYQVDGALGVHTRSAPGPALRSVLLR